MNLEKIRQECYDESGLDGADSLDEAFREGVDKALTKVSEWFANNVNEKALKALEKAKSRIIELHQDRDRNYSYETLNMIEDAIKFL